MSWFFLLIHLAYADAPVDQRIESTRLTISEADRQQREMLSHLFTINKKIREISRTRSQLSHKLLERDAMVRTTAQEVAALEEKSERQQSALNSRLRRLYQERKVPAMQWMFSAKSPMELEKQHRFMRIMIDSDHAQLKRYLTHIRGLKTKRNELKTMVAGLARMQREVERRELELAEQMREKSRFMAEIKKSKAVKLGELKELRQQSGANSAGYAFFERKGTLAPPVNAVLKREYGTFVDPQFRFKIMHKGFFYDAPKGMSVRAVSEGRVVLAGSLPGYGRTVIIDHGDNYYSVYAFNTELKVHEGTAVNEGDVLALSGVSSPLFGPGVYFEIRHFTDAIDPRQWIKEPVLKTANREELQ